jgi:hypothetical protein
MSACHGVSPPPRRHLVDPREQRPLSGSAVESATLAFVAPVSFFFPERNRSVSEAAAAYLVAQLQRRPDASETVTNLADRIATESHRGRFASPGQDLELDSEEQRELLDTLKTTAGSWPEEDRDALHELQLALAAQTSRLEQGDT